MNYGGGWVLPGPPIPTLNRPLHFYMNIYLRNLGIGCRKRTIGSKGEIITPLNILQVEFYEARLSIKIGTSLDTSEEGTRAATILSIYSARTASQAYGDYQARVLNTMENILKEPPYNLESLDTGAVIAKITWA
ncbi:hypothetical protein RUM43_012437 [Polyplax serrata]|uniref:Uncharacterized protein n=1 Tax=Polyplax serrata TaxID=468196 RepID=A0AAN8NX93_POLSC